MTADDILEEMKREVTRDSRARVFGGLSLPCSFSSNWTTLMPATRTSRSRSAVSAEDRSGDFDSPTRWPREIQNDPPAIRESRAILQMRRTDHIPEQLHDGPVA